MSTRYPAFGLSLQSNLDLPGLTADEDDGRPVVSIDLAGWSDVEGRFSPATSHRSTLHLEEGEKVDVVAGRRGDVLLRYGDRAIFHIAAHGTAILCAAADPGALHWQRVLLDTVLGTAALLRGHEALHAAAIELPEGVMAIAAPTGGGKTTLSTECVRRGARLFTDDLLFLTAGPDGPIAHPGPALVNLPAGQAGTSAWLGELVGVVEGEAWIWVRAACQTPAPLLGLVVLDRRRGTTGAHMSRTDSRVHMLSVALDSGWDAARRRARFVLLADLAARTPVFHLESGLDITPPALADVLESMSEQLQYR